MHGYYYVQLTGWQNTLATEPYTILHQLLVFFKGMKKTT